MTMPPIGAASAWRVAGNGGYLRLKHCKYGFYYLCRVNDKDIRKAGEVIKYRKNRESESKNVIDNEGRLQVKRIFAVLANRQLREKYFGFLISRTQNENNPIS